MTAAAPAAEARASTLKDQREVAVTIYNENLALVKDTRRIALPAGAGNAQFVGEDRIDHTPKNETVRLKLGEAFDMTADKKQTSFEKLGGTGRYNYTFDAAFEVRLKNAKDEPVTVKAIGPVVGDWQMLSESHPHRKKAANTAAWQVPVPANGATTLRYKVRVRF